MPTMPDELYERTGVRLTPRARILLFMLLDGLADEPIRWSDAPSRDEEMQRRRDAREKANGELRDLLRALAEASGKTGKQDVVTLYDVMHHFENLTARVIFFPGKLT